MLRLVRSGLSAAVLCCIVAVASAGISDRKREPVVLSAGDWFDAWIQQGIAANDLELWSYVDHDGDPQTTPIWRIAPHQVDEMVEGTLPFLGLENVIASLGEPECGSGSAPLPPNRIGPCERTYEFRGDSDPDGSLSDNDEVVFLAGSAGLCTAPITSWPQTTLDPSRRFRLHVRDNPGGNGEAGCVYAFVRQIGSKPAFLDQVDYDVTGDGVPAAPPSGPGCIPETASCGAIISGSPDVDGDGTVDSDIPTYRWDFHGNWTVDGWRIGETTTAASEDLVDLMKIRSTSPREHERTWDRTYELVADRNAGCAVFRGYIDGPIRVVRQIQGSASGVLTTKFEFAYPGEVHQRFYLRVHELPGPLYFANDLHKANVSSISSMPECTGTDQCAEIHHSGGLLDKVGGTIVMSELDTTEGGWYHMRSDIGSFFSRLSKNRSLSTYARRYDDRPDSEWGGAVPAEWDAETGDFGAYRYLWEGFGDTQNFFACIEPEDEVSLVTPIVERTLVMLDGGMGDSADGVNEETRRSRGVLGICVEEELPSSPPTPDPGNPCLPSLSVLYDNNSNAQDIGSTIVGPPCSDVVSWNLYESLGAGLYRRVASLPVGDRFLASDLKLSEQRVYVGSTVDSGCDESGFSSPLVVNQSDTVAPSAPTNVGVQVVGGTATASWDPPAGWDLTGFKVMVGDQPGGPYAQVHQGVLNKYARTLSFQTLPGSTYYLVMTAIDHASNESSHSTEVPFSVP